MINTFSHKSYISPKGIKTTGKKKNFLERNVNKIYRSHTIDTKIRDGGVKYGARIQTDGCGKPL